MADETTYKVPIRTVAHFLQILEQQKLRHTFTESAPRSLSEPPGSKPLGLPDASAQIPGLPPSDMPTDLFVMVDQWRASRNRNVAGKADIRLPLSSDMMDYARSFVIQHDLGPLHTLTKRLQSGDCPNPVECPQGV